MAFRAGLGITISVVICYQSPRKEMCGNVWFASLLLTELLLESIYILASPHLAPFLRMRPTWDLGETPI